MKEGVEVCSVPSGDDYILSFHGRNREFYCKLYSSLTLQSNFTGLDKIRIQMSDSGCHISALKDSLKNSDLMKTSECGRIYIEFHLHVVWFELAKKVITCSTV